jgi:hypothetical protein
MCPHTTICVLILLYLSSCYCMCPHTTICVLILLYVFVLILLYVCSHTTISMFSYYYMCPHATTCVHILHISVRIRVHTCPRASARTYVSSSYCAMGVSSVQSVLLFAGGSFLLFTIYTYVSTSVRGLKLRCKPLVLVALGSGKIC